MFDDNFAYRLFEAAWAVTPKERFNRLMHSVFETTRTIMRQHGVARAANYVKRFADEQCAPKYIEPLTGRGFSDAWYLIALVNTLAGERDALDVLRTIAVLDGGIRDGITAICAARYTEDDDERMDWLLISEQEFSDWLKYDYHPLAALGYHKKYYPAYDFAVAWLETLRRVYERTVAAGPRYIMSSKLEEE